MNILILIILIVVLYVLAKRFEHYLETKEENDDDLFL